jgi:hypothetical protein
MKEKNDYELTKEAKKANVTHKATLKEIGKNRKANSFEYPLPP